jgi:hypothetical protein
MGFLVMFFRSLLILNLDAVNSHTLKFMFLGIKEEGILRVPGSAARIRVRRHFVSTLRL